jgi:hypothetical protein
MKISPLVKLLEDYAAFRAPAADPNHGLGVAASSLAAGISIAEREQLKEEEKENGALYGVRVTDAELPKGK